MKSERTKCDFCDAIHDGPDGAWVDVVLRATQGGGYGQSMMGFLDICPKHDSLTWAQIKEVAAQHTTRRVGHGGGGMMIFADPPPRDPH